MPALWTSFARLRICGMQAPDGGLEIILADFQKHPALIRQRLDWPERSVSQGGGWPMPPDSKLETGTALSGRLLAIIRKPGKRPTALYLSGLFLSQAVSRLQYLRTVRRHIIWNSLLPDLTEDVAHLVG